jgi:hypothetical protein
MGTHIGPFIASDGTLSAEPWISTLGTQTQGVITKKSILKSKLNTKLESLPISSNMYSSMRNDNSNYGTTLDGMINHE